MTPEFATLRFTRRHGYARAFDVALLDNTWLLAAIWMSLAFIGALISIRFKVSAALIEIVLGILAGNLIALKTNNWIDFVAGFGSIMLIRRPRRD